MSTEPSELLPDGGFDLAGDPARPEVSVLLDAWGRRVRANRQQVERFAEKASGPDHYAPIASRFRVDPRRTGDVALDALLALARPDDTWLDVGAGGGRYALPLALAVREVIAVDPSEGMLNVLREASVEEGIQNMRIVPGRWPAISTDPSVRPPLQADVAFIAHVGYDIEQIGPFLEAMERSARRLCAALLFWRRPTWAADRLWPAVHGVERALLPAVRELVTLQFARGRPVSIRWLAAEPASYESVEQVHAFARMQTWVQPGTEKDRRLEAAIRERLIERDGRFAFDWSPWPLGLVTWEPSAAPVPDA
jgi:SAM-dependent methyltransferase